MEILAVLHVGAVVSACTNAGNADFPCTVIGGLLINVVPNYRLIKLVLHLNWI